ncbi:hypothetical protein CYY_000317 [Polysphondylium violaceum]|uniref:Uncharacterized protein n=1 Tax=Polysphondylium violaceum TaxID=133409 RepID=A0A8J4PZX5_9MYCE|nr:hypothetical protein CYY_000317 [Polysphondylium violaceum]
MVRKQQKRQENKEDKDNHIIFQIIKQYSSLSISVNSIRIMASLLRHVGSLIIKECFNLVISKGCKRISVETMKHATTLTIRCDLQTKCLSEAQKAMDSAIKKEFLIKPSFLKEMINQFATKVCAEEKALEFFSIVLETIIRELTLLLEKYLKNIKKERIMPRHILMCVLYTESFFILKTNEKIIFPSTGHISFFPFAELRDFRNPESSQPQLGEQEY